MIEAIDAEIPLLVVITEGVPVGDTAEAWAYAQSKGNTTRIIGPNCPGIITPGESLVGITPANITGKGPIGLVSKSGTLTYQMMYELREIGFSTAIGIGGDPIIGTTHIDALAAFEADPETKAIVMIGEIGGDAEERAADFIKANVTKPVVGYVAGFTAPEGKTMGHAGAIVSGSAGTAQAKKEALEAAGVKVGKTPSETADLMREIIQGLCSSAHAKRMPRPRSRHPFVVSQPVDAAPPKRETTADRPGSSLASTPPFATKSAATSSNMMRTSCCRAPSASTAARVTSSAKRRRWSTVRPGRSSTLMLGIPRRYGRRNRALAAAGPRTLVPCR